VARLIWLLVLTVVKFTTRIVLRKESGTVVIFFSLCLELHPVLEIESPACTLELLDNYTTAIFIKLQCYGSL
jgi:hypothetical protein